ncbi:hypothetical protein A5622_27625 [Mycobacterium sp. 1245801.1]|nr:hypothetical protein A5622_27625 [Mycobacterium sp. 1245801.1]
MLTVIGGWEMVRAQVNFNSFTDAGPDAEWAGSDKLAKTLREMALAARIRHPHDQWARVADEVSKVRHKFGHLLHLDEIEGVYPKRTLHFTRLGGAGEQRRGRGDSLGLSWRSDEWAQQTRHGDSVTEQELWQTLEKEYWLIQVARAVRRLGGILQESPNLADDHSITGAVWYIPWRLPEWGDRADLVLADLRLPPPQTSPPKQSRDACWPVLGPLGGRLLRHLKSKVGL